MNKAIRGGNPDVKNAQSYYTHTRPVRDPLYFDVPDDKAEPANARSKASTSLSTNAPSKPATNAQQPGNNAPPPLPPRKANQTTSISKDNAAAQAKKAALAQLNINKSRPPSSKSTKSVAQPAYDEDDEEYDEYDQYPPRGYQQQQQQQQWDQYDDDEEDMGGYNQGGYNDEEEYEEELNFNKKKNNQPVSNKVSKQQPPAQAKKDKHLPNERLYKPPSKSQPASPTRSKSRAQVNNGGYYDDEEEEDYDNEPIVAKRGDPYKPQAKTPMPPAKKDKFLPNERLYKPVPSKSRPASADRGVSRVDGGGGKEKKGGGAVGKSRTRANSWADTQSVRNNGGYGAQTDYDDDDEALDDDDFAVGGPSNDLYDDYIKTRAPSRADGGGFRGLKTAKPNRAITTNRNRSLSVGDVGGLARGKTAASTLAGAARTYDPWKAKTVTFFKNGDVHHRGVTYVFRTGRDVINFDVLCAQLTQKMPDLPSGVRFIFTADGEPVYSLEDIKDGESYVCSSSKHFKKIEYKKGDASTTNKKDPFNRSVVGSSTSVGSVTSLSSSTSSTSTVPGSRDGRRIWIINSKNPSLTSRVLLNPKTSQSFEAILNDWGQVLKMKNVVGMYTPSNAQVRSLSQLRNDFADVDEFYLQEADNGQKGAAPISKNLKPNGIKTRQDRNNNLPRSQSEPALNGMANDVTGDPINVVIRGKKQTLFPSSKAKSAKMDSTVPKETLQLDWVYGYRGSDSVSNLAVIPGSGELIYYVAAIVVMYDKNANRQRHYIEHTEDITTMALHPKKDMAMTGQKQGRSRRNAAHIRIWSLSTLQTLQVLGSGEIRIGVCAVAFSQKAKGALVVGIDSGENHIMRVWQLDTGDAVSKAGTQRDTIMGVKFHPLDTNLIISFGRNHLCFWSKKRDGNFDRVDAMGQNGSKPITITCMEFQKNGDLITGDSDGKVTLWSVDGEGTYMAAKEFQAHDKSVTCLLITPEGSLVSGSETDRRISAWDPFTFTLITETKLPEIAGGVRNIVSQMPGKAESGLFVGTTKNLILEGGLQAKFQPLVIGHGKQLWALAIHPTMPVFATAGYDRNILKWKNHRPEWRVQVQSECTSAAFSDDGKMLAVGTIDGHVTILKGDNGKHVATFRTANAPVSAAAFAPGGATLGLASQNGNVYIYRAERGGWMFRRAATLTGKHPLAHFDWSSSGEYIRAQSQDHDLLYWNVQKGEVEPNAEKMKDESWSTCSSTISYDTAGVWKNSNYVEESTISCCDRSYSQKLLVIGDVDGHLRLFRYPAVSSKAGFREMKAYSSLVTQVKFTFDDNCIITTGGTDAALMQWWIG